MGDAAASAVEARGFVAATVDGDGKPVAVADRAGMIVTAQDSGAQTLRPIGSTITLTLKKA